MIVETNKQSDNVICRLSTYKAIVDCLCNLLPEAQAAEKDPGLRTQSERDSLYILHQILFFDVGKALEAGVISRWLARYPFGGTDASVQKKKKTIRKLVDETDSFEDSEFGRHMRTILSVMSKMPAMRKEMVEHGLLDVLKGNNITIDVNSSHGIHWPWTDCVQDDWDMPEVPPRTFSEYSHHSRMRRGVPAGVSNRPREEIFEEQALRRRRREAMVLGEAGRPIERADIIERDSAALDGFRSQDMASLDDELEDESERSLAMVADEDTEEEFKSLIERITQVGSARDGSWWGWLTRLRPDGLTHETSSDR